MEHYWTWWIVAAVLIGAELLTGTFYLLAIGIAVGAGRRRGLAGRRAVRCSSQSRACWASSSRSWPIAGGSPAPRRRSSPGSTSGRRSRSGKPGIPTARCASPTAAPTWDAELADARRAARAETMYIVATRANVLVLSDQKPGA